MRKYDHTFQLETVYVVGTHDDFTTALSGKLAELVARQSDDTSLRGAPQISHAVAFDAEGNMHWSALVAGVLTTESTEDG